MSGLVDAHVHLQDYEPGTDVQAIIRQSMEAGVTALVCNGTEEADWPVVEALAEANACVIPFYGVHPWFVDRCSDGWLSALEGFLARSPHGVGEIGLDKNVEGVDRERQESFFRAQLRLATRMGLPVTIHCVHSWGWLMDVLRSEDELPPRMLIHAYGGSVDLIRPLAAMGAYFSFSGKVLCAGYARARAALAAVPADRLLIETDAPNMLPPDGYRPFVTPTSTGGEHNHPGNLPSILTGIAELTGRDAKELKDSVYQNTVNYIGRGTAQW